jgi:hypothetical protein
MKERGGRLVTKLGPPPFLGWVFIFPLVNFGLG